MNYQHPERPCIKVTRINGRGYEGMLVRRERLPSRLALIQSKEKSDG